MSWPLNLDKNGTKSKGLDPTFIGLNPKHTFSGSSVMGHARLSKVGNSELSKAFYMPALNDLVPDYL